MSGVSLDPVSGNHIHSKEHRVLVTFIDDSAYFGLMVLVYDYTGFNRFFLPLAYTMADNPMIIQALRYGLMFGSMTELRRWFDLYGISTDLSHYVNWLMSQFQ